MWQKRIFVGGLMACWAMAQTGWAGPEPLTLVKDGVATSVIVVPYAPNRSAQFAAKEIQTHIRKMTGAELKIVQEREPVDPALGRIAVGESELTRQLGLKMEELKPQEYALRFVPGMIALMGKDLDPDPWPMETGGSYTSTNGAFGAGWLRGGYVIGVKNHGFSDAAGTVDVWLSPGANGALWKAMAWYGSGHEAGTSVRRGVIEYRTIGNEPVFTNVLTAPMVTDGWHLVSFTWDAAANKKEILIDGKVAASGPYQQTHTDGLDFFCLGGTVASEDRREPFSWGGIDEFRLSSVVRAYTGAVPAQAFVADEQTKVLLHFDDKGGPRYDGHAFSGDIPDSYTPVGTCYAAYDFLEKYCGVRWYFPTELGTHVPKTATLVISNGVDVQRMPWLKSRGSTGYGGASAEEWGGRMNNILYNHANGDEANLFAFRMRLGGWRINFNHSFYGYYDRFWEKNDTNPDIFEGRQADWFAKETTGQDPWSAGRQRPPQLCYTSTGLIAHVIGEARAAFQGGAQTYGVVPMDNNSQCQCANCKPLLDSGTNKTFMFSSGYSSRLIWYFTDQVARGLVNEFPDRYIGQLSYFDYFQLPKGIDLATNIIAGPCMGLATCDSLEPEKNHEIRMYKEWIAEKKRTGRVLSCWIYQCFPNETGGQRGFKNFPGFHAHTLDKYMKMLAADGIEGIFLCGTSSHIDGYLTLRLMDDATLNVDTELDLFFKNFYGPAGVPLRKFYDAVEASFAVQKAGGTLGESYDRPGMAGLMKNGAQWIEEARKLAASEEQKKRVAMFEDAVWNHMKEGHAKYLEKFAGKDPYPLSFIAEAKGHEAGKFGNALKLNGVFGVWDHGFKDEQGTMELWVNAPGAGGTLFQITPREYNTGHYIGRFSYMNAAGEKRYGYEYRTWDGAVTNTVQVKPVSDGWHHLMATWSAAEQKMRLYVDGQPEGSASYKTTRCAGAKRLAIGGGIDADQQNSMISWSWGTVDELRLSSVVRKAAMQTAPYGGDKDTLLLLHCDEPDGQYPLDSSGRDWSKVR